MAELKPCPFCGGEADIYDYETEHDIYDSYTLGYVDTEIITKYVCVCPACGASGAEQTSEEEAIEAWNRRVSE